MLRKRYLEVSERAESEQSRESRQVMLTVPIGGVASGNEAHLREDDARGEFESKLSRR
jgi:hypothetical protein